jgi:7-keto-8-aminopelargonate synthetase-like enzyme
MTTTRNLHRFRHNETAIELGNQRWNEAAEAGVMNIAVTHHDGINLTDRHGHRFVNMTCLSYLGLESHPVIIGEARRALDEFHIIREPVSPARLHLKAQDDMEEGLSELFRARVISAQSCSAASLGILPLIASGHLTGGTPPLMLFDHFCHFSMLIAKPICADETEVLTCPHNDLDFIEDQCRKNAKVAYIADGAYSLGGGAPIRELLALQDRYGLFLYFDDSHSVSVCGALGEGFIRSRMPELTNDTVIVASLSKGFGAAGGAIMMSATQREDLVRRFGGPMLYSQAVSVPTIGATLGAIKVHRSAELGVRQAKLRENAAAFDDILSTPQRGDGFHIRSINVSHETRVIGIAKALYERGFYVSASFFPIAPRNTAALRVIVTAAHEKTQVEAFCRAVQDVMAAEGEAVEKAA